jgi:translation initiation factor 4G
MAPFSDYFSEIEKIISNEQISSRVRFLLQDLVDLRKNNWKPRREATGAGLKNIDQV